MSETKLTELTAALSEVVECQIRAMDMLAANINRQHMGWPPPYNASDFSKIVVRLKQIATDLGAQK